MPVARAVLLAAAVGVVPGALSEPTSRSPPMGWRSWNALGHDHGEVPTAAALEETFAALTNRSRTVDGVHTSLADLGCVPPDCGQRLPPTPL